MPNKYLGKRNMAIINGEEDLSEWSDEELLRGQRRDKNGNWRGRRPKFIPAPVYRERNSRRLDKAKEILSDSIVRAAEVLREVMDDPNAENRDKLKAAEMVIKIVTDRADFELKVEAPPAAWQQLLADSIVSLPAEDGVLDVPSSEVGDG